nr:hypothetical protein [Sphingomonas gilva]
MAALYAARVMEAFDMIRTETFTKGRARELVHACFHDLVSEIEAVGGYIPQTTEPELEIEEQRTLATDRIIQLRQQQLTQDFDGQVKSRADMVLVANGSSMLDLGEVARLDLLSGVARALVEQQNVFLLRLEDRLAPIRPVDPLFAKEIGQGGSNVDEAAVPPMLRSVPEPTGPRLGHAIASYLDTHRKVWRPRTHKARIWQLGYLEQFLGAERAIASITAHDIRAFRNGILALRVNHGRSPTQTFAEKQTASEKHRIAIKTATIIFEPTKAFFRWGKSVEGLIDTNPAEDIRIIADKKPKGQRTRRPFQEDELRMLFQSPLFTGCKSRHRRFVPGSSLIRDAKFWVPILGLYTGCRLGELIQLHLCDISLAGPIPFISINEDNNRGGDLKHVKSAAGVRRVPIHPDLIKLGFADYVAGYAKRRKGNRRLFDEIRYGCDGQASTEFSKFFARFMSLVDRLRSCLGSTN